MELTTASAALGILANLTKLLNSARERARVSNDTELKAVINSVYDEMAALKEAVHRVTEENNLLRKNKTSEAKPELEVRQVGAVNYCFLGGKGPYCVPCFRGKDRLVELAPQQEWNGGVRRQCPVCEKYFYEQPMSHQRPPQAGGPDSWMR